jgi:predicted NodU family carbamoyl transferase
MDASILISFHWDIEFHVQINTSNLVVKVVLTRNVTEKCDQPIAYASQLFNNVEWNYVMTKRETFAMVYVLHKFYHYLWITNSFSMWTIWH